MTSVEYMIRSAFARRIAEAIDREMTIEDADWELVGPDALPEPRKRESRTNTPTNETAPENGGEEL